MTKSIQLLLIEDSEEDAFSIIRLLEQGGYAVQSERVDEAPALRVALTGSRSWDLIICDFSMPAFDALAALAMVKEMRLDIPFIVISGAIGEAKAVEMMRAGAHDYLMKGNLKRMLPAVDRELQESAQRKLHRQTVSALKESEYRFSLFVRAVQEYAIFMCDSTGNIIHWNPGAENILGYSSDEVLGKNSLKFIKKEGLEKAFQEGSYQSEGWKICKNGSTFWADELITSIRDETGALTGFVTIVRDITLRKRAEDELRTAREKALAASRLKSDFLAHMSHELRTPLNGIMGMCELLLTTPLDADQMDLFETLQDSGKTLLNTVNGLLDFSKIESGQVRLESVEFDVRILIERIMSLLKFKVHKKNVSLNLEIAPNVPSLITGDSDKLGQVLTNLLDNAAKFTSEGNVILKVFMESGLTFQILDTGIGISQETRKKLFQPFVQADGSTTRKYGGTGLGLSIAKKLVELMGGQIGLESQEGHGSLFWFTVPL